MRSDISLPVPTNPSCGKLKIMVTTLDIDSELLDKLTENASARGLTLDRYVEAILREKLKDPGVEKLKVPFKNLSFPMGQPISQDIDLDKALALSFSLDDDSIRQHREAR